MALKTKVNIEEGKQEVAITRDFELPVELLFRAHVEADILEQWMGSKVLKLESRKHGGYQLEKRDEQGKVVFRGNGVFHDVIPNRKIVRTFEMENAPFDVQLEFVEFERLTDDTSRLNTLIVYKSGALRDQHMQFPFAPGLNMAHNRLQEVASKLK